MGVVLDLTSREYYTLNPAGIVLWRCFDGRALCDKAQLLKHLEAAFAVPDGVAERDVDGFLQQLEHERLLERVADREP